MSAIPGRSLFPRAAVAALLLLAVLLLGACDSGGDEGDGTPTATSASPSTAESPAASPSGGGAPTPTIEAGPGGEATAPVSTATPAGGSEDGADGVQSAVEAAVQALRDGNAAQFAAQWTEEGLLAQFQADRAQFGQQPPEQFATDVRLESIEAIDEDGQTATADTRMVFGRVVDSNRYSLVRQDGAWLIERIEQRDTAIPEGVAAVQVEMVESEFRFDAPALSRGDVALEVLNNGEQPHELVLVRKPPDVDLLEALLAQDERLADVEVLGFVFAQPGDTRNMVFAEPLAPGNYAMLCLFPDADDPQQAPHAAKGMLSEFTVGDASGAAPEGASTPSPEASPAASPGG